MFDEVVCGSLTEAGHPSISVSALCKLAELLDAQAAPMSSSPDECELNSTERDSRWLAVSEHDYWNWEPTCKRHGTTAWRL